MLLPLTFCKFSSRPELFHGVFNRHGGVSQPPFDRLNISFGVDDTPENVKANRKRIKDHLAIDIMVSGQQVHGTTIHIVSQKPHQDYEAKECDALISNVPGVGLMIQQADCQAVMLFDPQKNVVANVHCGWRGSVTNIIATVLQEMKKHFSSDPAAIQAAISPSLGPCCAEFINYKKELPQHFHSFMVKSNYFDFQAISRKQLCDAGVKKENITSSSICTVCNQDWFSYRREGRTGRFCSVIGLAGSNA